MSAWKRTLETWKRLLLVVNTLKEVVLRLCGVEVQERLQTSESRIAETSVETENTMRIKTGDLVQTCNKWSDHITLGVAYVWNEIPSGLISECVPHPDYIYIQPITGSVINSPTFRENYVGGYLPKNVKILNSLE